VLLSGKGPATHVFRRLYKKRPKQPQAKRCGGFAKGDGSRCRISESAILRRSPSGFVNMSRRRISPTLRRASASCRASWVAPRRRRSSLVTKLRKAAGRPHSSPRPVHARAHQPDAPSGAAALIVPDIRGGSGYIPPSDGTNHPCTAPPVSATMAIRPMPGTSQGSRITVPPASLAFRKRSSRSSTAT